MLVTLSLFGTGDQHIVYPKALVLIAAFYCFDAQPHSDALDNATNGCVGKYGNNINFSWELESI